MEKVSLVLIGGGGHCKSCIDVIEETGQFKIEGILEKNTKANNVLGYKIIGTDDMIPELIVMGYSFLITIGQIKSAEIRKSIFNRLLMLNARIPVIISPSAQVSRHATIEPGTIVMHNCIINADAKIGMNCIINSNAIIEHEALIGNHTHISTNSVINGCCEIGNEVFVGSGSVISNGIKIADSSVIGAQSLINKNILEAGVYIIEKRLKKVQ